MALTHIGAGARETVQQSNLHHLRPITEELAYRPALEYFNLIRDLKDPVWLDSGLNSKVAPADAGRFDILSAEPLEHLNYDPNAETNIEKKSTTNPTTLQPLRESLYSLAAVESNEDLPFCGGLIGYLSYEVNHKKFGLARHKGSSSTATVCMGLYAWAVILDHLKQRAYLVIHPDCPSQLKLTIKDRLTGSALSLGAISRESQSFELADLFKPSQTENQYLRSVEKIIDYLGAGDCYQVNLAQHFSASYSGDCAEAYMQLRELTPTPQGAYLGFAGRKILSLSPERFVQIQRNQIQTWPIKGTAPRSSNSAEDAQLARQLMDSEKNRAENLMIVDLMRNDLSTCCKPGSIRVPGLYELHSFPTVHHLVSRITGELAETEDAISVLEHCLPGGSITGAPKRRSMQIIAELEERDRGVYCGCIGYLSCCGSMDTNIAIRTLEADDEKIHAWGGGGIVIDSDPMSEYQETLDKIQPLLKELERNLKATQPAQGFA